VPLDSLGRVESELGRPRPRVDRRSLHRTQRLGELERAGIVRRRKLPPPAGARVYELTDWGRELEDIVISLGRWAARSPSGLADGPIGADSMILALRTRLDSSAADGPRARYELRLGEDRFSLHIDGDRLDAVRGDSDRPDVTIDTDPDTLAAVLWGGHSAADARRSGNMTIEGDKAAAERFLALFPMPEPAGAT
jgi:putative sterol carrier protein